MSDNYCHYSSTIRLVLICLFVAFVCVEMNVSKKMNDNNAKNQRIIDDSSSSGSKIVIDDNRKVSLNTIL